MERQPLPSEPQAQYVRLPLISDLVFRTVLGRDAPECKNPFHLNEYMVGKTKDYASRSILYTGQISVEGLESGEDYDKIKKVVHISIVSGSMEAGSAKYHGVYRYLEVGDKAQLSDQEEIDALVEMGEEAIVLADAILRKASQKEIARK
ncbi:MAG: hypothetical protein HFE75_04145 [Firmicutes bacterium]|jgi:hypothetical protein|nr:hypothetical protein [Bacillota bacterium]